MLLNLNEFSVHEVKRCRIDDSQELLDRDATFCFSSGGGISGLALAYLLNQDSLLAAAAARAMRARHGRSGFNPYAPKAPHFKPRATAVISLFMSGGVEPDGHVRSEARAARSTPDSRSTASGDVIVRQGIPGPLMPSPFAFKRYGQSGMDVSELFPQIARHVDEIAFLRSVYGQSNDHVQATYEMQTGQIHMGFPSVGSWVTYGLGSETEPAGVRGAHDARGGPLGGPNDWSAGFMPAAYQGTLFRSTGDPIVDLKPPAGVSPEQQRARLDLLAKLNEIDMQKHSRATPIWRRGSRRTSWRTGCRAARPRRVDIGSESEATRKLYGLDDKITEPFGRQCLMARRLVERGVRFVQLFSRRRWATRTPTRGTRTATSRRTTRSTPPSRTCRSPGC